VIPIGADHIVVRSNRSNSPNRDRFFADIEVQKAGNFGESIHLRGFFFEPADKEHLAIQGEKIVAFHTIIMPDGR
jgi:hypothetical protein